VRNLRYFVAYLLIIGFECTIGGLVLLNYLRSASLEGANNQQRSTAKTIFTYIVVLFDFGVAITVVLSNQTRREAQGKGNRLAIAGGQCEPNNAVDRSREETLAIIVPDEPKKKASVWIVLKANMMRLLRPPPSMLMERKNEGVTHKIIPNDTASGEVL
jgi:hypothetical protein